MQKTTFYRNPSPTLGERCFVKHSDAVGVEVVADWRTFFRSAVPYLARPEEPMNILVTTDATLPVWLVLYDTWRDDQKGGSRRDAAWLNRVVLYRFTLVEFCFLVPLFGMRAHSLWRWSMELLRDSTTVPDLLRAAAADILSNEAEPSALGLY